jgi:hypothetical protein
MKLVNLTPHPITLQTADGTKTTIEVSGTVARIDSSPGTPAIVAGCPVPVYSATVYGQPNGLPSPAVVAPDTLFVVSALFAGRVPGRKDVVYPGTGPNDGAIRDAKGQIAAVTRLIQA